MKRLVNFWKAGGWCALLLVVSGFAVSSRAADRVVRIEGGTAEPGRTNVVRVVLESLGNEKALGFNLGYDPAVLRFVSAQAGPDAVAIEATLQGNFNETTNFGRMSLALSLDFFSPDTFPAGSQVVAEVRFTPAAGVTGGVSAVVFTNAPGATEISDANAGELPATYVAGSVAVVLDCTFALETNAINFSGAAGAGSVSLFTSNEVCAWSVVNTNPWLTITSPLSSNGSAQISFMVDANSSGLTRIGVVTIAGLNLTVSQEAAGTCEFALVPTAATHGADVETNTFGVMAGAGCAWSVVNTNGWISILAGGSGSGNGPVTYAVSANELFSERVGALEVAGQIFSVTQQAVTCSYMVSPALLAHGSSGGTGIVSVATSANCLWNATTTNEWIVFTSPTNGSGDGSFAYSLLVNWSLTARTGAVLVAGQTLPVTQAAYTGGFVFRPFDLSVPGQISLSITGGPLGVWHLQSSSDLTNWSQLADLTNATGRVDFVTPAPTSNQFYRAVLP